MFLCRLSRKDCIVSSLFSPDKWCTVKLTVNRTHSSIGSQEDSEYTDFPNYPKIVDLSPDAVYKADRDKKLNKIKNLGTIEEKLIGINMPRYYGWSSLMLHEGNYPFNFMPFVQHITRTDFIESEKFPFCTNLSQSEIKDVINKIRPQLQDVIVMEISKKRRRHVVDGTSESMGEKELSDDVTKGVVEQINRVLAANLARHAPHLYEAEVDFEPRIEAFWRVGGFYPSQETYEKRKKEKEEYEKDRKKDYGYCPKKELEAPEQLVGHFIQYLGTPVLQLRHSKPLRPLEPRTSVTEESDVQSTTREPGVTNVPVVKFDPGFYGLEKIRRHGTNIPGFWPGDPNEFGLLSFHSRGHMLGRPSSFGDEDEAHTLRSQAMLAGNSWILGQANYQGFSTFHDLTYPLTTTTIVTDGRVFSFFASQVNTLLVHDEFIDVNPKVNVCYGLPTLELFQHIQDNEIIGWDDRVLSLLVEAYLNTPAEREGVELKPFVDKAVPFVKDIEHEERRVWLHNNYRHFFGNIPRQKMDPEIYDWEMIYKIKFQTRPMDARRRFFELGVDPWLRRLDQQGLVYIPRAIRDPNNPKKRYRNAYWPDC